MPVVIARALNAIRSPSFIHRQELYELDSVSLFSDSRKLNVETWTELRKWIWNVITFSRDRSYSFYNSSAIDVKVVNLEIISSWITFLRLNKVLLLLKLTSQKAIYFSVEVPEDYRSKLLFGKKYLKFFKGYSSEKSRKYEALKILLYFA